MFNKFILGSAIAAAIIFTGCSSKSPEVASSATNANGAGAGAGASASTAPAVDAVADAQSKIQSVLFDFDKFNIRADMAPIAEANAKTVGGVSAKVKLEGNADERGTDEYNYALGLKRANSVKAAYQAKGIAEASMTTVSLGEGNPVCKESTEECWAKNRRVDTKLEK
ncbi:MAG: OmpA family protein [Campylobacterales bacterium]|nr:OmpA family protein [Campylobacterales bacterium]